MKPRSCQKLSDEEMKAYIPNYRMELTLKEEVKRLRKVIGEKDECIRKFKAYDAQRSVEFHRLRQNYEIMEERFNEFNEVLDSCDEISDVRKYYKDVFSRLNRYVINSDTLKSIVQGISARIEKSREIMRQMESCISCVGNAEKRSELMDELQKLYHTSTQMDLFMKKKTNLLDSCDRQVSGE